MRDGLLSQNVASAIRKDRVPHQSVPFMDPEETRQQGYHVTPGHLQWSPPSRHPVDKSDWKPCHACGRLIPVVQDRVTRIIDVQAADQGTSDTGRAVKKEGIHPTQAVERAGTCRYVCPFCGHCHVGTPDDSQDTRAQTACHQCGTDLGASFQCPKCSFPRGWMIVQCPYCSNRQPVHAPHWVVGCDMFTLQCVSCESTFDSFCIC